MRTIIFVILASLLSSCASIQARCSDEAYVINNGYRDSDQCYERLTRELENRIRIYQAFKSHSTTCYTRKSFGRGFVTNCVEQ